MTKALRHAAQEAEGQHVAIDVLTGEILETRSKEIIVGAHRVDGEEVLVKGQCGDVDYFEPRKKRLREAVD